MTALDFTTDPATLDLVDSDDGWFEEDETASSAVVCQLTHELDEWVGDPTAGQRFKAGIALGDTEDAEQFLVVEAERALGVLEDEGLISNIEARAERQGGGRIALETTHRDNTSTDPVENLLDPYDGG